MDLVIQYRLFDERIKINDEMTYLYCEFIFLYKFIVETCLFIKKL